MWKNQLQENSISHPSYGQQAGTAVDAVLVLYSYERSSAVSTIPYWQPRNKHPSPDLIKG